MVSSVGTADDERQAGYAGRRCRAVPGSHERARLRAVGAVQFRKYLLALSDTLTRQVVKVAFKNDG
jgi:hypothetical protein